MIDLRILDRRPDPRVTSDPTTAELLIGIGCFVFSVAVTLGLTVIFA